MPKSKLAPQPQAFPSIPTLPPIPILPSGDLGCDPNPDPGGLLAKLQDESIESARHRFNTPGDVLIQERQRAEELEHERAKAAIWKQALVPVAMPAATPARASSRTSRREELIAAWTAANGVIPDYCRELDRRGVPLKNSAREFGVSTYEAAWEMDDKRLRKLIRNELRNAINADKTSRKNQVA